MAATKSNVPWSVKGIERNARETAKEAAQRDGMTVGAWLNQMIYATNSPQSSGGNVSGIKMSDIITAMEALNAKVSSSEAKSAEALDTLSKNFSGVVERVQRIERGSGDVQIDERLSKLEEKSVDRQRIDTLRALEKAVGQVALQFDSSHKESIARLNSQEEKIQQVAEQLANNENDPQSASALNYLKTAVEGLATRISRAERIASEATKLNSEVTDQVDAEFVERTGDRLRVLGDEIKRGGDQIRTLETTIGKLSSQIDAAEKRSAEGVHKVSETITELKNQFTVTDSAEGLQRQELEAAVTEATQRTEDKISSLQQSFESMVTRIERTGLENQIEEGDEAKDGDRLAKPTASQLLNQPVPEISINAPVVDEPSSQVEEELATAPEAADTTLEISDDDFDLSIFDLDDDSQTEETDEFAIDLDDPQSSASGLDAESNDILASVNEAFGNSDPFNGDKQSTANAEPDEFFNDTHDAEENNEFDSVLSELENLGLDTAVPDDQKADEPTKAIVKSEPDPLPSVDTDQQAAVSELPPAPVQQPKAPDDFLKSARLAARKAAHDAEVEAELTKKPKRKLSPKQRAILAARARQKQKLAEQGEVPTKSQSAAGNVKAELKATPDDEISKNLKESSGGNGDLFARLKNKLPFVGGDASTDEKTDLNSVEKSEKTTSFISGMSAKPVTMALAVSILLAVIALFFIVKDVILAPPSTKQPEATLTIKDPAIASTADQTVPADPLLKPRDLYLEGVAALKKANTPVTEKTAIDKIQQSATLGHPPAQLQIGELYKTGQGVPQDLAKARTWYERAAAGGNVLAMHRVGVMTAQGEGGQSDLPIAIEWFKKAANHALVDSQYNLGALYHPSVSDDDGIRDAGQAYYWYSLASTNGDDQAAALAASLADSLSPEQKSELDAAVANWTSTPAISSANEVTPAS